MKTTVRLSLLLLMSCGWVSCKKGAPATGGSSAVAAETPVDHLAAAFDIHVAKFDFSEAKQLTVLADSGGTRSSGLQAEVGAGPCWVAVQREPSKETLRVAVIEPSGFTSHTSLPNPLGERSFTSYPTGMAMPGAPGEFKIVETIEGEPKGRVLVIVEKP